MGPEPDDELELEDEELELEEEDELLLEEELDELEDELLEELELDELLDELDDEEPPPAGAKTQAARASWLVLEQVQLEAVPVEPAPESVPLLPDQREVWLPPAVKVALEAPLTTASTAKSPEGTLTLAEIEVPELTVLVAAETGAPETPLSEIEPATTPLTAPPKETDTV